MLQVKSFSIKDGDQISEFLRSHRIAEGASVFISEGTLAIPYDDGNRMNRTQRIIVIQEDIQKALSQMEVIKHSNKVMERMAKNAEKEIESLKVQIKEGGGLNKEQYELNRQSKDEIKVLEGQIKQYRGQARTNTAELNRLQTNVDVYEESLRAEREGKPAGE